MKNIVILGLILTFISCSETEQTDETKKTVLTTEQEVEKEAVVHKEVQGFILKSSELFIPINTIGTVKATKKGKITSDYSGTFEFDYVFEGKEFKKGQLIGKVRDIEFNNRYAKGYAAFDKAYINFLENDITKDFYGKKPLELYKMLKNSTNSGIIGRAKHTELYTNILSIKELEQEKRARRIVAPRQILISKVNVENGQNITKGLPLFDYIDNSEMVVEVSLFEKESAYLKVGETAIIKRHAIQSSKRYTGKVIGVASSISDDRFRKITIMLDENQFLIDGEQVDLVLKVSTDREGLQIPNKSIVYRDQRPVVFTVKGDLAQWNYVTLGERFGDYVEITDGVSSGDKIITKGHFTLAHMAYVTFNTVKN